MVIQLTKHQDLLLRMAEIKSSWKRENSKNAHVSCQEKKHVLVTFSARPNLLTLNTATLKMFVSQDINTPKSIKLVKSIRKKRKNDSSSMIDKGTGKKNKNK